MKTINLMKAYDLGTMLSYVESILDALPNDTFSGAGARDHEMLHRFSQLSVYLKDLELDVSASALDDITNELKSEDASVEHLRLLLFTLRRTINNESKQRNVLFLDRDKARWYEDVEPIFGQAVHDAFPSTRSDVTEAGKCYALSRATAAVFHSMRVLEPGLRQLAKQIPISSGQKPIDLQDWGNLIDQIEKAIKDLRQQKSSQQKAGDLQFYSEAAVQFSYFKDAWRNHVTHRRDVAYTEEQAYRVLEHVRDFMNHISSRLHE